MRAYNLFRRKDEADLYCAVPEDFAVPLFVTQETWEFAQSLELEVLSGFDATAAEASVKANGFYLFHSTDTGAGEAEKPDVRPNGTAGAKIGRHPIMTVQSTTK